MSAFCLRWLFDPPTCLTAMSLLSAARPLHLAMRQPLASSSTEPETVSTTRELRALQLTGPGRPGRPRYYVSRSNDVAICPPVLWVASPRSRYGRSWNGL